MLKLAVRDEGDLDTGERDYLDAIVEFVSLYERKQFSFEDHEITGLEALKYLMNANDMNQVQLAKTLGVGTSSASMILSGSRPITAGHARALGQRFCVDAGLFI